MNLNTIIGRIAILQGKFKKQFPGDKIISEDKVEEIIDNRLQGHFNQFYFEQEDIQELMEDEKLTLFILELSQTSPNETEFPVYYTHVQLDGLTIPLTETGQTDILQISVRFGELEEGDIDIERFTVTNDEEYQNVLMELNNTITHHFSMLGVEVDTEN